MKNIYRIMFWGLIAALSLAAGIVGVITNNQLFKQRENELKSIVNYYNNSELLREYRLANVMISSSLVNKDIVVSYDGVYSKKYKYELYNGYLKTSYSSSDAFGKVSLMLMADAISQYYGNDSKSLYPAFNSNYIYKYNMNDGISFEFKNDEYIVKLSLDKPVTPISEESFNDNYITNEGGSLDITSAEDLNDEENSTNDVTNENENTL